MAVHQLIPSFVPGDAMGASAIHYRWLLRGLGHTGEIYADELSPELAALGRPYSELAPRPDDLVLYHHGIASPLSGHLMHLPCRRGIIYHNITPARMYPGTPLEPALVAGRAQLAAMAPHVDLALAVSRYNARELVEAGYRKPRVVPLVLEPERFGADQADPSLGNALRGDGPTVISVGRVVRHKRMDDLLSLHEALLQRDARARLWIVGGFDSSEASFRALKARARQVSGVTFLGKVSHAQLVAAYRAASVYVSMSEHEGFGVPLIEAMACDLPVLAYATAAVPETLDGHGIGFVDKDFSALAQLVCALSQPGPLRDRVLRGQRRRLSDFSPKTVQHALGEALKSVKPVGSKRRSKPPRRRRVALVISRYGAGSGGAERHAQAVAERLASFCDVTVLTTRAQDHLRWDNDLPGGESEIGPVKVVRFDSGRPRAMREFNALSDRLFGHPLSRADEERWVAEQGPSAPGLLHHLETCADRYDAFLFFQYLYTPTLYGLPMVARRALLVPTAHEEPFFHFGVYRDVLQLPRALLCNTPEEAELIRGRCPDAARSRVVGVGVDAPRGEPERFRRKYGLNRPYLMYVGRVEGGKGIPELLAFHRQLKRASTNAPDLVLAGLKSMPVGGPGVHYLGSISEEDKSDGLRGAVATAIPSRFESLSLLALESFAQGTPILAQGACEVLAGQVERSGAGALFTDAESFRQGVEALSPAAPAMATRAQRYARSFTWKAVMAAYREEIEQVCRRETR